MEEEDEVKHKIWMMRRRCDWGGRLTGEHGGTSREDGVGVQVLADVDVALHDRVVASLVDAGRLHSEEGGLEERLGTAESLVSDRYHLSGRRDTFYC